MQSRTAVGLAVGVLLLGGCGGDEAGPTDRSTTTAPGSASATVATLGPVPDIGAGPGTAIVFLPEDEGGQLALDITECSIAPDAQPDGQVPAELLAMRASGTDGNGTQLHLDVRRFRSVGASPTVTDTITIVAGDLDAPERALVAQRFEVDGVVNDLRDPDADVPLLRIGGDSVEGHGLFGAPGATVPEVEGLVRALCP